MNLSAIWGRIDRLQRTTLFKLIASALVALGAIGAAVSYIVLRETTEAAMAAPMPQDGQDQAQVDAINATQRVIENILTAREDPTSVGVGIVVGAGVLLAIIWLNLLLTYLALALASVAASGLLFLFGAPGMARVVSGSFVLVAAFTAGTRLLQAALGGSAPVFAIARNVLVEATRMKISIVFLVLLVFMLPALPMLLDAGSPLRYRVQSFLQWSTAASFWLIALLSVLLVMSSVCFEQRDKVIWQTMTKPVAAWEYLLGKWLGVVSLAAVLLLTCASGIFLFTEYLRGQTAVGEARPYVATGAAGIAEDRLILETQVLTARRAVRPEPPVINEEQFEANIREYIRRERLTNPSFARDPRYPGDDERYDPAVLRKVRDDMRESLMGAYRSIERDRFEAYLFTGIGEARRSNKPVIFTYRIDAGANRPDEVYRLSFRFGDGAPIVQQAALGQKQTIALLPTTVSEDGELFVQIANTDIYNGLREGENPETISFPKGALEVSYQAASFHANFFRVTVVLWVKLAFLAMVAVLASTFLSFPVACLVTLGTFFAAETTPFLLSSLENYSSVDDQNQVVLVKVLIRAISFAVAYLFKIYADLKPIGRLVQGELLSWGEVALGTAVLSALGAVLYGFAVLIFRRRELATYSGK